MSKDFDTTDLRTRAKQREAEYIDAGFRNAWAGVTQVEIDAQRQKPRTNWFKRLLDGIAAELRSDT